jgi:SAM-dependent methyltransferase
LRPSVRRFVELCAEALPLAPPVLEFGSFQVQEPCQEDLNDLRSLFAGTDYIGADLRGGPGVDVIMDIHDAGARTGSVGTVLLLDTLEHVEFPHRALEEVHRLLAPRGTVILSSVMDFPIHEHPSDFWRFTPQGVRSLLRPFPDALVDSLGEPDFPHTVVGIGLKGTMPDDVCLALAEKVRAWRQEWDVPGNGAGRSMMERLVPPLVHELRGRVRR